MGIADLTGPWAKLRRAEEHSRVLGEELRAFTDQNAKSVFVEYRREEGWYVIYLHPIPALPARLALIAGDCLNNARAALDHLVWQLVLREDQEPRQAHCFPLYDSRQEFVNKVETPAKKGKQGSPLYGIPINGDAWALIERAQPYHRPEPQIDELWLLAQFTKIDKHRMLLVQRTFLHPDVILNQIRWRSDLQPIECRYAIRPLSPEQPTEIVRLRFVSGVDPGVEVEGTLRVDPSVGDSNTQAGLDMLTVVTRRVGEILKQTATLPRVQP